MWQKESKHKNALYTNICGSGTYIDEIYKDVRSEINAHKKMTVLYSKSDETALNKRKWAQYHFENGEWNDAIELFNESLCFAEKGSPNIGIAYANRSACFFNLKMYDKCLVDIDLAIENHCPKPMKWRLERRKLSCLKYIEDGAQANERILTLDFDADERYPGLSSAVQFQKDTNNQHTVVATQNIDVGQIVAIDKAFTKTLFIIYGWKCNICLRSQTNLVPCKKCTTAMFCHDCVDNNLHQYECGMKTSLWNQYNNYLMHELRTFFVAMNLFSTANEMMDFVEQSLGIDPREIPDSLADERSRYRAFLNMRNHVTAKIETDRQFGAIILCTYKILLEIPKVQTMFETKKHRRFLMHLVGHHVEINLHQSYYEIKEFENEHGDKQQRRLYSQVGLFLRYFNHSCSPNVYPIDVNGDTVYVVVRPIQAGEQLRVSYYSFHWHPLEERKRDAKTINCKCERCRDDFPSNDEAHQLRLEPEYWSIESYRSYAFDSIDADEFNALKLRCMNILKKYDRLKWCKELGIVMLGIVQ